jgi:hypothetical protein
MPPRLIILDGAGPFTRREISSTPMTHRFASRPHHIASMKTLHVETPIMHVCRDWIRFDNSAAYWSPRHLIYMLLSPLIATARSYSSNGLFH